MRIAFFGSGAFGLPTLERLCSEHEVVLVVTQPDRPAGRKRVLTATPVGAWAAERGLTVWKHEDINEEAVVARLAGLELEASVVIAFGQKLSEALIGAMGALAVNLHGSLLPAYRGAAPVQRAVMDGLAETGVSVIGLAQRMDAGLVYGTASLSVGERETSGEVHDRLAALGPAAVGRVLERLAAGRLEPVEQDESLATRARKLSKAEGTVDFSERGARACGAWINGLNPWPGCRVVWRKAGAGGEPGTLLIRRVEALAGVTTDAAAGAVVAGLEGLGDDLGVAASGGGVVRLLELQAPGTRVMSAVDFAAGRGLGMGDRLEAWAVSADA